MVIFVLNDNLISISNVKNEATGALIDDATVTVTVKDFNDVNVTGQSWPLVLLPQGGGSYQGTIESTAGIIANKKYKIVWDVVKGSLVAHGEAIFTAEVRHG